MQRDGSYVWGRIAVPAQNNVIVKQALNHLFESKWKIDNVKNK